MGVCPVVVHAPNVAPLGLGAGAVDAGNKRYPPPAAKVWICPLQGLRSCNHQANTRRLYVDTRRHASVRENMPYEEMGDCQIEVRDKHGRLLTKVSEAILSQFLSVMESYTSRIDPPQISDGDCCCYPVRSARDFELFLRREHRRPWVIVLPDQPPEAESQCESRLAAALFDVSPPSLEVESVAP